MSYPQRSVTSTWASMDMTAFDMLVDGADASMLRQIAKSLYRDVQTVRVATVPLNSHTAPNSGATPLISNLVSAAVYQQRVPSDVSDSLDSSMDRLSSNPRRGALLPTTSSVPALGSPTAVAVTAAVAPPRHDSSEAMHGLIANVLQTHNRAAPAHHGPPSHSQQAARDKTITDLPGPSPQLSTQQPTRNNPPAATLTTFTTKHDASIASHTSTIQPAAESPAAAEVLRALPEGSIRKSSQAFVRLSDIFFYQDYVASAFSDCRTFQSTIDLLRRDPGAIAYVIPHISVIKYRGRFYGMGNRRLCCFHYTLPADTPIPVKLTELNDDAQMLPQGDGKSVSIGGGTMIDGRLKFRFFHCLSEQAR